MQEDSKGDFVVRLLHGNSCGHNLIQFSKILFVQEKRGIQLLKLLCLKGR